MFSTIFNNKGLNFNYFFINLSIYHVFRYDLHIMLQYKFKEIRGTKQCQKTRIRRHESEARLSLIFND